MGRRIQKIRDLTGKGPVGFITSACFFFVCLIVDKRIIGLSMPISASWRIALGIALICVAVLVFVLSFMALSPTNHNRILVNHGPYNHVRHPRYSALVFFFFPSLAFLLGSVICLLATPVIYYLFLIAAGSEEKNLVSLFGDEYLKYQLETPALFPSNWLRKEKRE